MSSHSLFLKMILSVGGFLMLVISTNAAPLEAEMLAHGALQLPDRSSTIPTIPIPRLPGRALNVSVEVPELIW